MHLQLKSLFAVACCVNPADYSPQKAAQPELPAAFKPGVRRGGELLTKQPFVRCPELGEVTDIAFGRVDGDDRALLVVAGTKGYEVFDPETARSLRRVGFEATQPKPFSDSAIRCRILDVDGDGDLEFARLAAHWVGRTSLHGADGKVVWVHPPGEWEPMSGEAVDSTSVKDIDGDGKLDFLMTFNATPEVHRIDHKGKLVWSQEWSSPIVNDDFVFADVDRDGHEDVLYVDGKALFVRDSMGHVITRITLPVPGFTNALHVLRDSSDPTQGELIVGIYAGDQSGQRFYRYGMDAKTLIGGETCIADLRHRLDSRRIDLGENASVAWLKLDTLLRQAEVAGYDAARLQVLLSDTAGRLVYEEVIDSPDGRMIATDGAAGILPATGRNGPALLVGYGSTIWSYAPPRQR